MRATILNLRALILLNLVVIGAAFEVCILLQSILFPNAPILSGQCLLAVTGTLATLLVLALAARRVYRQLALASNDALKFDSLLQAAPEAIVITTQDGRITLTNQRAEQLFGYPRRE